MPTLATIVGNPVDDSDRYLDREMSWLDFDARVLALCESPTTPTLERAKFLAIFASNLDEYFQTRVAALKERADAHTASARNIRRQLQHIRERAGELVAYQSKLFASIIAPALTDVGIEFVNWADLNDTELELLQQEFHARLYPVLTPLAVDPAHPFPYVSNVSLNLAVMVQDPTTGEQRFARVKVPPLLPRFVALGDTTRFVAIEEIIAANLDALFPGMKIVSHHTFRVTRDVEIELSDDSEDLLEAVELVLQRQTKFGRAVRLECASATPADIVDLVVDELELHPNDVYRVDGLLDLASLFQIYEIERPELKFTTFRPQIPVEFAKADSSTFTELRDHDVIVHHPYDSFAGTVEAFVELAARDPDVLAIKQTLYRTGGDEEGIAESLAQAALAGKQVVVLVEITARGDEQRNVERARMLEEAGVHVVYGIVGLKTHAKILLVVRREADGLRRYCHVGTGNYNPKTAKIYEDLGVFSADPILGADVAELFNYLTGYSRPRDYRRFIVAPGALRPRLLERIAGQAHPLGRIVMKMNALVDLEMVDALYAAASAGASIDLLIRGVCCLRPGVAGLSESIRVRSILGRYLEHSRIYSFGSGLDAEYLIGSADLMPRNLDRRVEALTEIVGDDERDRIREVLSICLHPDIRAWQLQANGTWITGEGDRDAHLDFEALAEQRHHGRNRDAP